MEQQTASTAHRVKSIASLLNPHLSDAARAALAVRHDTVTDDMITIARRYPGLLLDDDYRQLGHDLSVMVEILPQVVHVRTTGCPNQALIDGTLTPVMTLPLQDGTVIAMTYVRMIGCESDEVRALIKKTLIDRCQLHVTEAGVVPTVMQR